jgi:hypothetical protein
MLCGQDCFYRMIAILSSVNTNLRVELIGKMTNRVKSNNFLVMGQRVLNLLGLLQWLLGFWFPQIL